MLAGTAMEKGVVAQVPGDPLHATMVLLRPGMGVRTAVCILVAIALSPIALADAGNDFDRGYKLAEEKGCLECHAMGRSYIGPSFAAIAQRYRRNPEYRDRLPHIIRGGSAGHWGERFVMWPQVRLSNQEVRELVDWVLSQ